MAGSNVVIALPKPCLVGFFRGLGFVLGFLCRKAGLLPAFPGDDRVIRRGETFLFANGGDPSINRLLVKQLQTI